MSYSFLHTVAGHVLQTHGTKLSHLRFIFPNRRAGLFFRRYLAQTAAQVMFAPQCQTINELFADFSPLQKAEPLDCLFRLYNAYNDQYLLPNRREESFDEFVFWGQMMLSDFNEVDTHLVDAKQLFRNISDLKDIDFEFQQLTPEQRESMARFIAGFQQTPTTENRQRFLHIWRCLYPIYEQFERELRADNLGTNGMIARDALQHIDTQLDQATSPLHYIFIGFNALTATERALMLHLQKRNMAHFYWDYTSPFLRDPNNRASLFRQDNLTQFAPATIDLPQPTDEQLPQIGLIQIPSYLGQAEYIQTLLSNLNSDTDLTKVGVILPQEQMLEPVILHIPQNISTINITMGLPLKSTPVYSLLQHLNELQKRLVSGSFYYKPVLALLSHPYIQTDQTRLLKQQMQQRNLTYVPPTFFQDSPLLQAIFQPIDSTQTIHYIRQILTLLLPAQETDSNEFIARREFLLAALRLTNQLETQLSRHEQVARLIEKKTIFLLYRRLLEHVSFPFAGEPLQGLQVMGMLESRGMDFSTLIITNVNDDTLPGRSAHQSYIPYDLRHAYGLPTPERQDAIYAYNFYRLIAHAERVYLLQNTLTDDLHSGEVSRYVLQLQYQYNLPITNTAITYPAYREQRSEIQINKTPDVLHSITQALCPADNDKKGKGLSASAINTYVACPLRFYLQYVKQYTESDKIEEEMQVSEFGTILHAVMEQLYNSTLPDGHITEDIIDQLFKQLRETDIVEQIYKQTFLRTTETDKPLEGKDLLPIHVIRQYAEHIFLYDRRLTPFQYISSELYAETRIPVDGKPVLIKGIIDRVDKVNGNIRIVDYKTGGEHSDFPLLENLYSYDEAASADHVRQTLFYCLLYATHAQGEDFIPHIYYARAKQDEIDKEICSNTPALHGYQQMQEQFEQALYKLLTDIFDPAQPFTARPDPKGHCQYCPFKSICAVQ